MINTKKDYESPTTRVLEIHIKGAILNTSGTMNPDSWTSGQSDWFNDLP